MWLHFAVGAGFILALNLPLVVATGVVALHATGRAERAGDELGRERLARLEQYVMRA
jgi:hypothetical protein